MELRKTSPKQMQLINDDYLGRVEKLRHACRGMLISEGKILLCHESESGLYIYVLSDFLQKYTRISCYLILRVSL